MMVSVDGGCCHGAHVHGISHLLASPQPRRSCRYLCRPRDEGVEDCLIVLRVRYRWMLALVSVACFLHCFERNASFDGVAAHFTEQVANDFVADGSYSYPPTLPHKLDNHASRCKCFARSWRPLDRKH